MPTIVWPRHSFTVVRSDPRSQHTFCVKMILDALQVLSRRVRNKELPRQTQQTYRPADQEMELGGHRDAALLRKPKHVAKSSLIGDRAPGCRSRRTSPNRLLCREPCS